VTVKSFIFRKQKWCNGKKYENILMAAGIDINFAYWNKLSLVQREATHTAK